jgi:hypothetical protein
VHGSTKAHKDLPNVRSMTHPAAGYHCLRSTVARDRDPWVLTPLPGPGNVEQITVNEMFNKVLESLVGGDSNRGTGSPRSFVPPKTERSRKGRATDL